jgi:glycosyltransferase involved in cell wall biosynthesis
VEAHKQTGATPPMVSICIPTYNGRRHLAECLDSILAQTFDGFEVVICDDQSSDGTLDLAKQLAGDDQRFRFISNPRRFGLVGNWNNCVQQASGDWIKFVFQDDIIAPACVEKLLAACQRENKLFGFCERDFIFEAGTTEKLRDWFAGHKQRLRTDYQADPLINAQQAARLAVNDPGHNLVGEPTVTLINKKLFQELGGFDEALIQICDLDFWCRAMANYGAVFVPESLATFRIHANATTSQNFSKREFRMTMLDPLVFQYKFAFTDDFKSARNPQFTGKSIMAIRWECMNFAARALRHANYIYNKSGDDSLIKEWKTVTSHYRHLHVVATVGRGFEFLLRIKNGIKRRILPAKER